MGGEQEAASRFMEAVFGFFMLIFGLLMMSSVVGLIIGIPVAIAGWSLMTGADTMADE